VVWPFGVTKNSRSRTRLTADQGAFRSVSNSVAFKYSCFRDNGVLAVSGDLVKSTFHSSRSHFPRRRCAKPSYDDLEGIMQSAAQANVDAHTALLRATTRRTRSVVPVSLPPVTDKALPPVTMVVPTRNRAHTLQLVAASYYEQEIVNEVIFVDDAGQDNTAEVVEAFGQRFPKVRTVLLRNPERAGAAESRNRGAAIACNKYILFCDDDEMLEEGYARTCLGKLLQTGAGAVSGRRVYMRDGETSDGALSRFGFGIRPGPPYRALICDHCHADSPGTKVWL
jgi:hypothetical protein